MKHMKRSLEIRVRYSGGAYLARGGGFSGSSTGREEAAAQVVAMKAAGFPTRWKDPDFKPFGETGIELTPLSKGGYLATWEEGSRGDAEARSGEAVLALEELLLAAELMWEFYQDLSKCNPGFMCLLVLQDYARWNNAVTRLPAAIKRMRGDDSRKDAETQRGEGK